MILWMTDRTLILPTSPRGHAFGEVDRATRHFAVDGFAEVAKLFRDYQENPLSLIWQLYVGTNSAMLPEI